MNRNCLSFGNMSIAVENLTHDALVLDLEKVAFSLTFGYVLGRYWHVALWLPHTTT